MKAEKLIELICHPEKNKSDDLLELETLVNRYPYFQSARILYLKAMSTFATARFRNELKSSTIYITDHKQFYKYLNDLLAFDHLQPIHPAHPDPLTDIVSDRIREINGYLTVNTVGIPANKEKRTEKERREREHILQVDFPQSQSPAPSFNQVPPQFTNLQKEPEEEIVSNPIFLDDMPGVINDYSEYEKQKTPKQQPIYEVVEQRNPEAYHIETLSSFNQATFREETEIPESSSSVLSIELIPEEETGDATVAPAQDATEVPEQKKENISLQELPEMLGSYRLEDDTDHESTSEPSISELAALVNKKRKEKKTERNKLIDKFIIEEPTIPRGNLDNVENRDLSEESSLEQEDLFSETLAKIYIKQQLYEKAIATYIKLSLKYPEKSVYFAHRIEKIKAKINNNE